MDIQSLTQALNNVFGTGNMERFYTTLQNLNYKFDELSPDERKKKSPIILYCKLDRHEISDCTFNFPLAIESRVKDSSLFLNRISCPSLSIRTNASASTVLDSVTDTDMSIVLKGDAKK